MPEIDILGSLIPDPITMLAQLMATGILLFVIKKYLWGPVTNFLTTRSAIAQAALDEAFEAQTLAKSQQEAAANELRAASQKAQGMLAHSEMEAKKIKEELLLEAQQQAQQRLTLASQQIELQRQEMEQAIQKEIVDVAMLASERLMQEKIDEDFDRQAIAAFVEEVKHS